MAQQIPTPTFDQVYEWCERHDSHPAEGWLLALLDGSYSVDEMRDAILAGRAPELEASIGASTKTLVDQILQLPDYRGWSVSQKDDYSREMDERLVWTHFDRDEKIWFDVVRKGRDHVGLWINVDDPNDDPYHPRGGYERIAEHTAEAVFAVFKPLLDEHASNEDDDEADDDRDESDESGLEETP